MYRTGSFVFWLVLVLAEMVIFFALSYESLYVPEKVESLIRHKDPNVDMHRLLSMAIRVKDFHCLAFAVLVAILDVIIFAMFYYEEIFMLGFGGMWFGHLFILSVLFIGLAIICLLLVASVFLGENCKENKLKRYFEEKYNVIIE